MLLCDLQACEWVLNLLLEAHQRPLGAEDEKRLKLAAIHLSSKMYACHRLMGNIPAAWMVIRRLIRIPVDTGDNSERCTYTLSHWQPVLGSLLHL